MATPRICSVDGCDNPRSARGMCDKHYRRWKNHGSTGKPPGKARKGIYKPCPMCGARFYVKRADVKRRTCCSRACSAALVSSRHQPEEEAFWSKVLVASPNDCWPWQAAVGNGGYGILTWGSRFWRAHRLSYFLANGEFDEALHVRHKCDNPPCVNPAHLELGTQAENMRDMVDRGRCNSTGPRGERSANSKLTERAVREVRRRQGSGESARAVALDYGVSASTIQRVWSRESWAWLK